MGECVSEEGFYTERSNRRLFPGQRRVVCRLIGRTFSSRCVGGRVLPHSGTADPSEADSICPEDIGGCSTTDVRWSSLTLFAYPVQYDPGDDWSGRLYHLFLLRLFVRSPVSTPALRCVGLGFPYPRCRFHCPSRLLSFLTSVDEAHIGFVARQTGVHYWIPIRLADKPKLPGSAVPSQESSAGHRFLRLSSRHSIDSDVVTQVVASSVILDAYPPSAHSEFCRRT